MDKSEARAVLSTHLGSFRACSYRDLISLMGEVQVAEVRGPSGAEYQIEVDVLWDSPGEKTNVRVIGSIDDGRLPGAFVPLSESFIVAPDEEFVGERRMLGHGNRSINDKRQMLRHFLAALAYRTQKALRGMPDDFPRFQAGLDSRSPHQLICHMTNVLGFGRTFFIGGRFPSRVPTDFRNDLTAFHEMLADLSSHLERGTPLQGITEERLLQGPFSDAMTHAGQLALLRRLADSPVPPEDFSMADISANNVGADQKDPVAPDTEWPERPANG